MSWLAKTILQRTYFFLILFSLFTFNIGAEETASFPFLGQVTGEGVNIRAGQSANFEKVGRLKAGDHVVVIEKSFSWYKIKLPIDAKCYISARYLKELDKKTGEVTASRVNIRAGAGEQFSALAQTDKGQLVRILEKLEGWYKVEPPEESFGWITEGYIKFHSKELPPARIVEVPVRNIYARKRLAAEEATATAAKAASAAATVAASEGKLPAAKVSLPTTLVTGVVEGLADQSIAQDIRYTIGGENNGSYYLKFPPNMMDIFVHRRVTLEGMIQPDITAPHPVILVKKINLIL